MDTSAGYEISKIFLTICGRYFMLAGLPFIFFYVLFSKKFSSNKIQQAKAKYSDFIRDILHSLVTAVVFAVSGYIVLLTPFRDLTLIYLKIDALPVWWIPVSFALSMIVHDTYFYWMHRLIHRKELFRWVHKEHHKSINPSPWTSYSFHFLEAILENGILFIIVFIMPLHPLTIWLFVIIGFIINVYGHLGYETAPKWFRNSILFEISATSVYHNQHHSKFKGNYGLYFRLWDRLMKTEHPEYVRLYDKIQLQRFGSKADRSTSIFSASNVAGQEPIGGGPRGSLKRDGI